MPKKNIHINSIFARLILTFLVILIPVYLLSIGIQTWGQTIIQKEITNSISSLTDYYKVSLEDEFARIENLVIEGISDDDLLKLANIPESLSVYERFQSMNRLQSKMYTIKNSSIYITNAVVIIPFLEKSISANDGVSDISETEISIAENYQIKDNLKIVNQNNTLYIRTRDVYSSIYGVKPKFIIQVEFSNEMLQKALITYNKYKGSGLMFFSPEQEYVLQADEDDAVHSKIMDNALKSSTQETNFNNMFEVNDTNYLASYAKLDHINFWLAVYIPVNEVYSPLNMYKYLLWLFTLISVIIIAIFSYSTHQFINRPMKNLVNAFHRVEAGDMKYFIEHKTNDEFQYLYKRFNAMLNNVNNLIDQVYKQQIRSQKAELKQLQSQINPHFLYNSFFIMQRMIQGDNKENALKFCGYLGKYFQYVTRNKKDEISLEEEVGHVKNYIGIQAMRFSEIKIEFESLPEEYKDLMVPRLILQPIIENTFEHGFNSSGKQRIISIKFEKDIKGLRCIIEDNGNSIDESELKRINGLFENDEINKSEDTGLFNIHKRIQIKFGDKSGLHVSQGELGGWKTQIFFNVGEEA